jgi:acetylglutamate kinase
MKRSRPPGKSSLENGMQRKIRNLSTDQTAMEILRRMRTKGMVFMNFVGKIATNMPQMKRRSKTQKSSVENRMKRKIYTDQTARVILRGTRTRRMVFMNFVG